MAAKKKKPATKKTPAPKKSAAPKKKSAPKTKSAPKKKSAAAKRRLSARWVSSITSRAAAEALPKAEQAQLAVAVQGLLGAKPNFKAAVDALTKERMGVYKVALFDGKKPVYDVWINTVMDDGSVLLAGTAKDSGIGISQMRVYDMMESRDAECAAIDDALFNGRLALPEFEEWS